MQDKPGDCHSRDVSHDHYARFRCWSHCHPLMTSGWSRLARWLLIPPTIDSGEPTENPQWLSAPMPILTMLQWLAATRWSIALHESVYVWPLLESAHVLCLALFVGTAIMLDLRLLGVAMTHIPASAFTQRLLPWTRGGFVIMAVTGVLLFTATPVDYY